MWWKWWNHSWWHYQCWSCYQDETCINSKQKKIALADSTTVNNNNFRAMKIDDDFCILIKYTLAPEYFEWCTFKALCQYLIYFGYFRMAFQYVCSSNLIKWKMSLINDFVRTIFIHLMEIHFIAWQLIWLRCIWSGMWIWFYSCMNSKLRHCNWRYRQNSIDCRSKCNFK